MKTIWHMRDVKQGNSHYDGCQSIGSNKRCTCMMGVSFSMADTCQMETTKHCHVYNASRDVITKGNMNVTSHHSHVQDHCFSV